MAHELSRREKTVPIGGNLKMRVQEMDITSYEEGGEDFAPADVNMRRFVFVVPLQVSADDFNVNYDEDAEAVKLLDHNGEVGAGETATVVLVSVGV